MRFFEAAAVFFRNYGRLSGSAQTRSSVAPDAASVDRSMSACAKRNGEQTASTPKITARGSPPGRRTTHISRKREHS